MVSLQAKDGARLSAWWMKVSNSNGNCVAVLHGIRESRASSLRFAPMLMGQGYSVLLPDSRAHGESGGEFISYGLLEKYDVQGWAGWLKASGCQKIYGLGESLGAAILIQAASLGPEFSAIVAECSFADLREAGELRLRRMLGMPDWLGVPAAAIAVRSGEFYARWANGLRLDDVSPVTAIAAGSTPILLIHGMNDTRTPAEDSERLVRANTRDALWLVPGAPHVDAFGTQPEEFRRRVLAWFGEH